VTGTAESLIRHVVPSWNVETYYFLRHPIKLKNYFDRESFRFLVNLNPEFPWATASLPPIYSLSTTVFSHSKLSLILEWALFWARWASLYVVTYKECFFYNRYRRETRAACCEARLKFEEDVTDKIVNHVLEHHTGATTSNAMIDMMECAATNENGPFLILYFPFRREAHVLCYIINQTEEGSRVSTRKGVRIMHRAIIWGDVDGRSNRKGRRKWQPNRNLQNRHHQFTIILTSNYSKKFQL
jgi:hypothetical protein